MSQCEVCGSEPRYQWSDTHGVGVCSRCGLPYRVYHYDENNKRVNKPAEVAITPIGVEAAKMYWAATQRRVWPAAYDIGILGSRGGRSYSGATEGDIAAWDEWIAEHKDSLPAGLFISEETEAT